MAHRHRHARPTPPAGGGVRPLRIALGITASVLVLEAIGGWLTGSVALLADAGHMLTDAGALAIALFASWVGARARTPHKSFGYGRAEVLGALINGLLLGGVSVAVAIESVERLGSAHRVAAGPMVAIAAVGLAANLVCARILGRSARANLNVQAAFYHVIGDLLGSLTALAAGVGILVFDLHGADPVGGLVIAGLLVVSAFRLLRESSDILLEGAPRGLDLGAVEREIRQIEGVQSLHDLHIWTVTSGFLAMSGHVDLARGADPERVRRAVHRLLHQKYAIEHTTIQTERVELLSIEESRE